jgi:hypothetical protein
MHARLLGNGGLDSGAASLDRDLPLRLVRELWAIAAELFGVNDGLWSSALKLTGVQPMSSPPSPIPFESYDLPPALWSLELREGERLVWAVRPMLAGCFKELLWLYPFVLLFGIGFLVGGWYFYEWAAGAGARWDFTAIAILVILIWSGVGFIVVPLLWPLSLWRSAYALTTQRLIVRQPALMVLWPRIYELRASQVDRVRLKCTWTWLPEETGDISFGDGASEIMQRVPQAEEVVALIHRTLGKIQ